MIGSSRAARRIALATLVAAATAIASAQAPLPLRGQGGPGQPGQGAAGGRGRGQAQPSNLPTAAMVSPLAAISAEVKGPGAMFPALMSMPSGEDMAFYK